jgi:hypothetical protein
LRKGSGPHTLNRKSSFSVAKGVAVPTTGGIVAIRFHTIAEAVKGIDGINGD